MISDNLGLVREQFDGFLGQPMVPHTAIILTVPNAISPRATDGRRAGVPVINEWSKASEFRQIGMTLFANIMTFRIPRLIHESKPKHGSKTNPTPTPYNGKQHIQSKIQYIEEALLIIA